MKEFLDLSVPLGVIDDYRNFRGKGKLGRIQRLLERHCGLRLRIDKLQAELNRIEEELLIVNPKIFDAGQGFRGAFSIPLRPELKQARRSGIATAMRNSIILKASSLTAHQICKRLDSYQIPVVRRWKKDFPGVKTWQAAYRHPGCRRRVDKLISEVRALGSSL